jgi:type I restriction enzyme S subunit
VPTIDEQREIVRRVDELLDRSGTILSHLDAGLALASGASQAVLAKAFRGELPLAGSQVGDVD